MVSRSSVEAATASVRVPAASTPLSTSAPVVSTPSDSPSFHSLSLAQPILDTLDKLGFTTPTPIQQRAIPVALSGSDIIGIAQTGTGKTLAFGLPILQRLATKTQRGRALILLPTRELAIQVEESLQKVGKTFRLKTALLIGGAPIRPQQQLLRGNPDVIIATPGRLIDHLQSGVLDLRTVDTLVLDEADRMLDMGFAPQIRQIVRAIPTERQTMLFSATMPDPIVQMSRDFLIKPERVEVERPGTTAEGVAQELCIIAQEGKGDLLIRVLDAYSGSVLVFARTRSRARRVSRDLNRQGVSAAEIHADRTLTQRRAALDGFKSGKYRVLVATDIAARGIDVTGIELVVNFDLPDCADDYVHRIGRTGRAGRTGHAIAFAAPDQGAMVREIEKLIRQQLPLAARNTGEFDRKSAPASSPRGNGGRPRMAPTRSLTQRNAAPRSASSPSREAGSESRHTERTARTPQTGGPARGRSTGNGGLQRGRTLSGRGMSSGR